MQNQLIGIVGGMGPRAGVALHEAIIRNTMVNKDQDHLSVVLMTFPRELADRTAYLEGSNLINPAYGILSIIEKLIALGAKIIGIPCNTSHVPEIYKPIEEYIRNQHHDVRLVHLPSEVVEHLRHSYPGHRKVGLMSTNGTFKSKLYQDILKRNGYEVVTPDFDFQDQVIHQMIYNTAFGVKANSVNLTQEAISLWCKTLCFFKDRGVDNLILGCTELSLINKQYTEMDIPIIDTIEVLAMALIREATRNLFEAEIMDSREVSLD